MDINSEILFRLGQIQAKQDMQDEAQEVISVKLDECLASTNRVTEIVDKIAPEVADYTKMKHRGYGIIATIGVLGTLFATFLLDAFKAFLKS